MKIRTYKLKDISYMGLSLGYLFPVILVAIVTLVSVANSSLNGQWYRLVFFLIAGMSITGGLYHVGTKYGQHGLSIFVAKFFQPRRVRNNFPVIRPFLVGPHGAKNKDEKNGELGR